MPATMTATAPERTETWSSWSNLPVGTDIMGHDDFMRSLGARLLMGKATHTERQMMCVDDIDVPEHMPAGMGLFHTPSTGTRLISTN